MEKGRGLRQLKKNKPRAANQKKPRKIRMLPAVPVGARSRQEDKRRRAEMGNPSRKENPQCRSTRGDAGKDPDMIYRHEDHHRAANKIYGSQSRSLGVRILAHAVPLSCCWFLG